MGLEGKPVEAIEEADLQHLVDNQVRERKCYEYKQALPSSSDRDKKELLADVSSLANASGGYLIYGMKEKRGVASEVCGMTLIDIETEQLRLESIIRDGVEPRIPGICIQPIPLKNSAVAIVIRIPRSWALPHMVRFKGLSKFFSRNSAGKYQLDVAELRTLFLLSETTAERIRRLRAERLGIIVAGETPVAVPEGPKMVLHVVPISAFDPGARYHLHQITDPWSMTRPLCSTGITDSRYNFDGFLTYDRLDASSEDISYLQIFRNGALEAVDTTIFYYAKKSQKKHIAGVAYEREILDALPRFLAIQEKLGVEPPLFVMVSLLGILGYTIIVDRATFPAAERDKIDRDTLLTPEVLVETFVADAAQVMRPIFDAIWNASGWGGSPNYDSEGKWVNPQRNS